MQQSPLLGGKNNLSHFLRLEWPPFPTVIGRTVLSLGAQVQNLFQAFYNYEIGFGILFVIKINGNLPVPEQIWISLGINCGLGEGRQGDRWQS